MEEALKKRRKLRPLLITVIVTSVIGYLTYTGLRDTMTYYLSVPEVLANPSEFQSEVIRVGGNVSADSVQWDPKDLKLYFKIGNKQSSLNVDYRGVVPDSFKPGREVIVEGTYQGKGKFNATSIMPKCASKYE
jgi:cytochrome c-type biogenesis protein CcmE